MEPRKCQYKLCKKQAFQLFFYLRKKLKKLYSGIRFLIRRHPIPRPRVVIRRLAKFSSRWISKEVQRLKQSRIDLNGLIHASAYVKPIRVVTFNAALFAVAPVVPNAQLYFGSTELAYGEKSYPRSILKNSPSHCALISPEHNKFTKSKQRVSINLPENEIALSRSKLLDSSDLDDVSTCRNHWSSVPVRSPLCFPFALSDGESLTQGNPTLFDVLKEVDADILALQDVKADEEMSMQPLSSLADALGMTYVFAESWAPEYGNAILSKWPIKRWSVQKILEHEDIRNVLKATIDVPWSGEVDVYCTQLDYLEENWRMKQIKAIIQSSEGPHILAGGLNSLNRSDYSLERWTAIIKYFEGIGKPRPKDEVMKVLKARGYEDAKDYAGECEPVVIAAKGQNVQGTCKYGTRVDYILSSHNSPYKFVPGSYSVISSKATSDHHIVKVDLIKTDNRCFGKSTKEDCFRSKHKVVRLGTPPTMGFC